jgi:hypothetical protein
VPLDNSTNAQLDATVKKLEGALINGDLQIQNENGTFYVSKSSRCADMKCQVSTGEVLAPTYVSKNDASYINSRVYSIICILLSISVLF